MSLIPTQITFRGLEPSEALESYVRERAEQLERFYSGIVHCHVLVELPHRHAEHGRRFHVRIELTVGGGGPIVVSHDPSPHGAGDVEDDALRKADETAAVHRYARVAVGDAFDSARRQLEDFARQQRHSHHDRRGGRAAV